MCEVNYYREKINVGNHFLQLYSIFSSFEFLSSPSSIPCELVFYILPGNLIAITPHLPHAWDCGHLMELQTQTLLCGDLFSQNGDGTPAITEADILGPSELSRKNMDYYSHSIKEPALIERLANENPTTLACMHGSVWKGDGARLLRELAQELAK